MVFLTLRGQFGNILGLPFGDILAGLVFTIAALTDTFDGYFARKHGMVTNLGKIIDPLADKILVIAALISLVQLQRLPAWIVVIILSREFFVTGLRMVAASEGVVISASRGGKVKTVTQVIAILLMIFDLPGGLPAMGWSTWPRLKAFFLNLPFTLQGPPSGASSHQSLPLAGGPGGLSFFDAPYQGEYNVTLRNAPRFDADRGEVNV